MSKFEQMKHYLNNKGAKLDYETLEEIEDYVKSNISKEVYENYTESNYIKEFLKDMVLCALNDDRLDDLKDYADVLYVVFRNEF